MAPETHAEPWRSSRIVTLLTDFGQRDPYVGIMKGVIARTEPGLAAVVDLTHEVPPQDVRTAAFQLRHAWRWFPEGTVHVAVVDPGVGSERRCIVARHAGHAFLAPDNGLLGPVLDEGASVRILDADRFGLPVRSRTFHGRDVFAPAAAHVAAGTDPGAMGPRAEEWERLSFPAPEVGADGEVLAEVLLADRFGNLVGNVPGDWLEGGPEAWEAEVDGRALRVVGTYAEAAPGEAVALVDSYDLVELAVRDGDAARELGLQAGAKWKLRRRR